MKNMYSYIYIKLLTCNAEISIYIWNNINLSILCSIRYCVVEIVYIFITIRSIQCLFGNNWFGYFLINRLFCFKAFWSFLVPTDFHSSSFLCIVIVLLFSSGAFSYYHSFLNYFGIFWFIHFFHISMYEFYFLIIL